MRFKTLGGKAGALGITKEEVLDAVKGIREKDKKNRIKLIFVELILCGGSKTSVSHKRIRGVRGLDETLRITGQAAWMFITRRGESYHILMDELAQIAHEWYPRRVSLKTRLSNRLAQDFEDRFGLVEGRVGWKALVEETCGNLINKSGKASQEHRKLRFVFQGIHGEPGDILQVNTELAASLTAWPLEEILKGEALWRFVGYTEGGEVVIKNQFNRKTKVPPWSCLLAPKEDENGSCREEER